MSFEEWKEVVLEELLEQSLYIDDEGYFFFIPSRILLDFLIEKLKGENYELSERCESEIRQKVFRKNGN